ncbi:nucleotide-binding domain-containing protein [Nemania abortiva]|nr:nucleotide-binding domain-containing protein [Nemania abortiva]
MAHTARTNDSPDTQTLQHRRPEHEAGDVIIVGGGVIGLCTAYNLAKATQTATKTKTWRKIIVLEARGSPFLAASSHNTGCLHYGFLDSFAKDLFEIGEYSFELWDSIASRDAQFVADTGFRRQSFFPIIPSTTGVDGLLPNWVQVEDGWSVNCGARGSVNATVNSKGIGVWLERECAKLGVEIWTSTKIVAASLSQAGTVESIKFTSTKSNETYSHPCQKLILAAGPWTPSQFELLFPDSTLDLQPSTNAGDWAILQNPNPVNLNTTAVVFFDDIVHEKLEYAGRSDGTIWVYGTRNHTAVLPPPGQEDEPSEEVINSLIRYSERFIHKGQGDDDNENLRLRVREKGRSFRPFTASGLPVLSAVPPQRLISSISFQGQQLASNVFICYGHGSYGITLGMGSGKLMAQVVCGQKPDIDLSKFTLT